MSRSLKPRPSDQEDAEITTASVAQSPEFIHTIVQALNFGVTVHVSPDRILYSNEAAAHSSGYPTLEEFLQSDLRSRHAGIVMTDGETGKRVAIQHLPVFRVFAGEPTAQMLVRRHDLTNDTDQWLEIRSSALVLPTSRHRFVLSTFRDVTVSQRAQQALRDSEVQYRAIFESSSDYLMIQDLDGTVIEMNRALHELYGWAFGEIGDQIEGRSGHPAILDIPSPDMHSLLVQGGMVTERVHLTSGDDSKYLDVTRKPFAYKDKFRVLTVVRDVTEQVEAVALLEQHVAERTAELSARVAEMETLYRAAEVLHHSLQIGEVLEALADTAMETFHPDKLSIHILDTESPLLRVGASRGFDPESIPNMTLSLGEGMAGQAVLDDEPIITFNMAEDERFPPNMVAHEKFVSGISVPIGTGGSIIGAFTLGFFQPAGFTDREVRLLRALADLAGVAIVNARSYEQSIQTAAQEERYRLARDLHDSITQMLYNVTLTAEAARRQLQSGDLPGIERRLARTADIAGQALKEMRLLIHSLRPAIQGDLCLVDALSKRLDEVERHSGIRAEIHERGSGDLPARVEMELYWIALEALNNAVKHGRATAVTVDIQKNRRRVVLTVRDNGRGFTLTTPENKQGLGLTTMRERAERLGGTWLVESEIGKGTRVRAIVPLRRESPMLT